MTSQEKRIQSGFDEACNWIHKIVGEYVHNYEQRVSRNEERNCHTVSLTAYCRWPHCDHKVVAVVSTDTEKWGNKLVQGFIRRAEFHAKKHQIIKATSLPVRRGS